MSSHSVREDLEPGIETSKPEYSHVDKLRRLQGNDIEVDPQMYKRLNRKLDMRIIPWVFGMWFFAYIDKANIGIAKINGLPEELGVAKGTKFNVALLVFYITYILVDIPSNWIIKRISAGIYLPTLIILWGLVTTFSGFIKTFPQLIVIRLLLGLCEGGLLGGIAVYLAMFYRRHELGWRIGVFYSAAPISSAFGGILATGLSKVTAGGYNKWPWIFFIEGAVTVVFGVICLIFMPSTPADAKFLTEEERILAMARMKTDGHGAITQEDVNEERFNWHWVALAFKAPQVYLTSLIWMSMLIPLYSYVLFLPTIISGLGYNNLQAQLLIAPPCVGAFLTVLVMAFYSDAIKARSPIVMAGVAFASIGYIMLLAAKQNGVRYAGTFFIPMGLYPASALVMGWLSNNLAPHYVRATGLGALIAFANTAAFPASFIYLANDAPRYILGHAVCLGSCILCFIMVILHAAYLMRENKKRENGHCDGRLHEETEDNLGHRHPAFKYTL